MASGPGALSVALKPSGVLAVANAAKPALLEKFGALPISNPARIKQPIPGSGGIASNTDVDITITGGKFHPTSLSLSNLRQGSDGEFTVDAVLTGKLQFANWHEKNKTTSAPTDPGEPPLSATSLFDSSEFVITFQKINLTLPVKIQLNDEHRLTPSVTNAHVTDKPEFKFNLPSKTALTSSVFSCVTDGVNSEISNRIAVITDSVVSIVRSGLNDLFSVIPESGKLTNNVDFLFPGTPGGLAFPNNNGVQYRVLGKVQWKGKDAPGDVGAVAFPPIPTDNHDAIFFANNYEFNALFWAFYKDGALHFSFNKGNVRFVPAFNSDYYKGTPLKAIAEKYPNRNLIVDLVLSEAPLVLVMEGEAQVTYSANMSFWVAKEGSVSEKDPDAKLFEVALKLNDKMEDFAISTNANYLQLITFRVTTIKEFSSKVTSSNIPGVDPEMLEMIWKFILHPVYTDILDKAAQAGVPLPSALKGVFTNYSIELHAGYASAAVNFTSRGKYEHILKKRHGIAIRELKAPCVNLAIL